MKKVFLLVVLTIVITAITAAQADYKVVFDLTSKDSLDQRAVLRWMTEISSSSPDAKLEVAMYGQGVILCVKGKSNYETNISKLLRNKNISFKVCAVALKNQGFVPADLVPGVEIVPDGIYEIISKQHEGWGYIKAVH